MGPVPLAPAVGSPRPGERFIAALQTGYPALIWGVMRRRAVEATGLIGGFVNADRYFLAELLLRGPAEVLPETLFSVRRHEGSFTGDFSRLAYRDRLKWFNPRTSLRGLAPATATALRLGRRLVLEPMPLRDRGVCLSYLGRRATRFLGRRARDLLSIGRVPHPAAAGGGQRPQAEADVQPVLPRPR